MCRVLRVSRSGYYSWEKREVSPRRKQNEALLVEITRVYAASKKRYGSPRIYRQLKDEQIACGRHRIARLMRKNKIVCARVKKYKCAARSKQRRVIVAENILNRRFEVRQPNRVWASDMTCFWTGAGWLHLAIVMDLFSRKIIGWAMGNRMTEDLAIGAFKMAQFSRQAKRKLLHHSDQGSQYTGDRFRGLLKASQIECSMSRKGNCHDNAVVESFFKSLKSEIPEHRKFKTREEARKELFEYVEVFYNRKRLHSTLNYQSPEAFEQSFNLT